MATQPRALLIAMLAPSVVDYMWRVVTENRLDVMLGRKLFVRDNWHQSLSGRHFSPTDDVLRKLCAAGSRISAAAFQMQFNRITSKPGQRVHWQFGVRGRPAGFDPLLVNVQHALATESIADGEKHSPHATLCYDAPEHREPLGFDPIDWLVSEVQLVIGEDTPRGYRYRTLEQWSLHAAQVQAGAQLVLL
ncbi:2'-5' RNA ligase family protein [Pseudoxanthomonas yeongjuensis]|uniref:2'-5' RNA ligase family protein n=1 Tax=Pseudoxanthomonas yeongjuensis TaxID=377616 RepID=UPI001390D02E|nr:hypothetical protein [Pseudoxanthomonas yeongjuensis]